MGTSNDSGISLGFTEIMPWQSVPLEESLPTCQKGDSFTVGEVKMLEKQTSPPDYLTEAELITLMEKHGIGRYPVWGLHSQGLGQEVMIVKLLMIYISLAQHEVTDGPMYNPWVQADTLCRAIYKALSSGLTWPSIRRVSYRLVHHETATH